MIRLKPKRKTITTEINLNESAGIPVSFTRVDKNRVKKVKLNIKPKITPKGYFLSPAIVPVRTIGSMGSIQGDSMVTIPARKAKIRRRSIE